MPGVNWKNYEMGWFGMINAEREPLSMNNWYEQNWESK